MKFEVDTGAVSSVYARLTEKINGIEAQRNGMFQELEALDGMWTGEAHDTFVQAYQSDNEKVRSLVELLKSLVEHIELSRKSYDDCEEKAVHEIEAIDI